MFEPTSQFTKVGLFSLRFFNFCSSVLVMSLMSAAMSEYGFYGSRRFNFGLAQGCIGTFHSMATIIMPFFFPSMIYAGFYLFWEVVIMMLWLASFIVTAKVVGEHGCNLKHTDSYDSKHGSVNAFNESSGAYDPFTDKYTTKAHKTACHCAQSAIAFSGLSWALTFVSSCILYFYVCKPIMANHGRSGLWANGNSIGCKLNRFTTLTLDEDGSSNYNMNAAEPVHTPAPVRSRATPAETTTPRVSRSAAAPAAEEGVSETDIESDAASGKLSQSSGSSSAEEKV